MEEHVNFRKTYLKFGLYAGILLSILNLTLLILEDFNSVWSNLFYLIIIATIFLGYLTYKKQGNGFLNYSRALGLGTMITLAGGSIAALVDLIYKSINSGVTEKMIEAQKQVLYEQGFNEAQIEQSMEFTGFLLQPVPSFFIAVLVYVFFGFIFSLVLGAIAKKNNPNPLE